MSEVSKTWMITWVVELSIMKEIMAFLKAIRKKEITSFKGHDYQSSMQRVKAD